MTGNREQGTGNSGKKIQKAERLIPAIAQDAGTGEVLMLAYMNKESLRRTLRTGYAHYWSRSRRKLWKKGETSGHVQRVKEVRLDCDRDTILLKVDQTGPACHTGNPNCFFRAVGRNGRVSSVKRQSRRSSRSLGSVLDSLFATIDQRIRDRSRGSYTVALTTPDRKKGKSGLDKVLEKIGEEATEVVLAAKGKKQAYVVSEVSDLLYHVMVLLKLRGLRPEDIAEELERRGA